MIIMPRIVRNLAAVLILSVTALLLPIAASAQTSPTPVASADSCRFCHQQQINSGFSHSIHGTQGDGCTGCHGASEAHVSAPAKVPPTVRFGAGTEGEAGAEACLGCHRQDAAHWAFSAHASGDTGCAGCHRIHGGSDPVMHRGTEFQVCTDCHQKEKAEQMRFSRHPMLEGHVVCTDCHAPHGGAAMNDLTAASVNEVCYQCHADKRGPFLFEHEPVQEDCGHCHLPHGSVNDQLLKTREPLLCQQCHMASRHPSRVYDSQWLQERNINIVGQSCTNCHSQVHGGNQPASATFRR